MTTPAAQLRAVQTLVRESVASIDALAPDAMRALMPALRDARDELRTDLYQWLARVDDGHEKFSAYQKTQALRALESSMERLGALQPAMSRALGALRPETGALSVRNLDTEIHRLSSLFEGGVPTIPQIDTAAVIAQGNRLLWKRHEMSAKRYAGDAGEDIRHLLAVGVAKGETFEQLVTRLRRLGGAHRYSTAIDPGAHSSEIADGLFQRHKHWADRLVRTEAMHAYNVQHDLSIAFANDNRIEGDEEYVRRWDASADVVTCPRCRELHGTTAPIDGLFKGGIKNPPLHPYCRCVVLAWLPRWGGLVDAHGHERSPIPESSRFVPPDGVERTMRARDITQHGYFEPIPGLDREKYAKAKRAILDGQRDPVQIAVGPNGALEVHDGRHRLRAASDLNAEVRVKFDRGRYAGKGEGLRFIGGTDGATMTFDMIAETHAAPKGGVAPPQKLKKPERVSRAVPRGSAPRTGPNASTESRAEYALKVIESYGIANPGMFDTEIAEARAIYASKVGQDDSIATQLEERAKSLAAKVKSPARNAKQQSLPVEGKPAIIETVPVKPTPTPAAPIVAPVPVVKPAPAQPAVVVDPGYTRHRDTDQQVIFKAGKSDITALRTYEGKWKVYGGSAKTPEFATKAEAVAEAEKRAKAKAAENVLKANEKAAKKAAAVAAPAPTNVDPRAIPPGAQIGRLRRSGLVERDEATGRMMLNARGIAHFAELAAKKEKRAAGIGVGTCQVCNRQCAIVSKLISLHGYSRPGWGFIVGSCRGAQELPFELDCSVLAKWITEMRGLLASAELRLAELQTRETFGHKEPQRDAQGLAVTLGAAKMPVYDVTQVGPDDPRYAKARAEVVGPVEDQIEQLKTEIPRQEHRLAGWRPVAGYKLGAE